MSFKPGDLVVLQQKLDLGAWPWNHPTEKFQIKWSPGEVAMFLETTVSKESKYVRDLLLLGDKLCVVIRLCKNKNTIFKKYTESKE